MPFWKRNLILITPKILNTTYLMVKMPCKQRWLLDPCVSCCTSTVPNWNDDLFLSSKWSKKQKKCFFCCFCKSKFCVRFHVICQHISTFSLFFLFCLINYVKWKVFYSIELRVGIVETAFDSMRTTVDDITIIKFLVTLQLVCVCVFGEHWKWTFVQMQTEIIC